MATEIKRFKNASNKSNVTNGNNCNSQILSTLSDDHDFIAPDEICPSAIGLLYWITKKYINDRSFSIVYAEKESNGFIDILVKERDTLPKNIISVQKCLVINRVIAEYTQDQDNFVSRIGYLFNELQTRMSSVVPPLWTEQQQYQQVLDWQELQARRRLFYISHDEYGQLQTLLTLQRAATTICIYLIDKSKKDSTFWQNEGRNRLTQLIYHSFIIVAQPTGPHCRTATQYIKQHGRNLAQLNTRIICLLDSRLIDKYIQLSDVDIKLYSFKRQVTGIGDSQPSLQWRTKTIISAEGQSLSFLYIQLDSITLNELDAQGKYPLYNSILCELEFQTKVKIIGTSIQIDLGFISEPFAICSHARFFPEFTAKILLVRMETDPLINMTPEIQQTVLADMVHRHYTLISGVEPNQFTYDFFIKTFKDAYERNNKAVPVTVFTIYQETLAKLIAQIKCLADYPFLSLMYYDGLFAGICDRIMDERLNGDEDQPHLYLRFNSLGTQKSTDNAVVRYIVHNGRLSRATFEMITFPHDICRLIFESASQRAAKTAIYSTKMNITFQYFQFYFDQQLYRISGIPPPDPNQYNPLIPVLWEIMRNRDRNNSTNSTIHLSESNHTESYDAYNHQSNTTNSTDEQFIVTAQMDPVNSGHVTVSIQYNDQNALCNDALIQLISKKLADLCTVNESRHNGFSNYQSVQMTQPTTTQNQNIYQQTIGSQSPSIQTIYPMQAYPASTPDNYYQ